MSAWVEPGDDYVGWQMHGSCLDHPSEWFFPEEETRKTVRRERERLAKSICRGCPVLATCRDHALRAGEKHGIWGAMTARERATDRRLGLAG